MSSLKSDFLRYLGQTNPSPLRVEIEHAQGCFLYSPGGKKYLDLISGFSVSNIGHGHPKVKKAIRDQLDRYLHTMVYGEYVQAPQVQYAKLLVQQLPDTLNKVFFVNSGSEAIEGAMKLAKRHTGRPEFISFRNAYHGSTHGALSIMGSEYYKTSFRPLLPSTKLLDFNNFDQLKQISRQTAAVVVEPIQAEAGIIEPEADFLKALRQRCDETQTLLILDEVQTGFGRTGSLFAFEQYGFIPDILVLAKALGGGLPLGAFIASAELMKDLTHNPVLGHITTFGGHPLSCAAGKAALEVILEGELPNKARKDGEYILRNMNHPLITEKRGKGLFLAFRLQKADQVKQFFDICHENGLLFDLFLFNDDSFRIAPPLIITQDERDEMIKLINVCLDKLE